MGLVDQYAWWHDTECLHKLRFKDECENEGGDNGGGWGRKCSSNRYMINLYFLWYKLAFIAIWKSIGLSPRWPGFDHRQRH